MINLDTNVLARIFVEDDAEQAAVARTFVAAHLSAERPGFVSSVVMAELCWVLDHAYRYPPAQIARVVGQLLSTPELVVDRAQSVRAVLIAYAENSIDFVDALIAAVGAAAGCSETVTFDRRFARQNGVRLLR